MWILLGRGIFANLASVCAWNPVQSALEKFESSATLVHVRSGVLARVMSGELRQSAMIRVGESSFRIPWVDWSISSARLLPLESLWRSGV